MALQRKGELNVKVKYFQKDVASKVAQQAMHLVLPWPLVFKHVLKDLGPGPCTPLGSAT